jgi:hypothetical protein
MPPPAPFILKQNPDIRKTSFVNWRLSKGNDIQNLQAMADGFLDAALYLTRTCLQDNQDKKADIVIFPILTNLNHGIELYLKAMIWTLNELLCKADKTIGGHDIRQLLFTFQSLLLECKDQSWITHFNSYNQALIKYIDEIYHQLSPGGKALDMTYSRYPYDKEYNSFFYVEELGNVTIDMEALEKVIIDIKDGLEERASYFYYQELLQEW